MIGPTREQVVEWDRLSKEGGLVGSTLRLAAIAYAAGQASKASDGWKIEKKPDGIIVISKKGFGGYAASPSQQESFIANEILYELASDLLAAAPSQEGGA